MTNKGTPRRDIDGWFVSSYTNGSGACVEVKHAERGRILVRDSKDRYTTSPIAVPSDGWAFLLKNLINPE